MINKKKEGGFYASKVRLFLNEYDGIPLEEFCKAEKVSYSKMLNCLGRTNHQYHPVDSFTYLCDIFRLIKNTAKEDLVYLLEHKLQPVSVQVVA